MLLLYEERVLGFHVLSLGQGRMLYSYGAVFASEAISTMIAIYFGESIIANEVLGATKGRSMGWGFVAFGFGMSFAVGAFVLLCWPIKS